MKIEKLDILQIEWKRGNGLRKSDLNENGKNKCILYGELYTKHKRVLIESSEISRTDKEGKVHSKKGDILVPGTSTAAKKDMLLAREIDEDGVILGGDINIIRTEKGLFAKKYLPYYFETFTAYDQLDRYITGATGIIHISNKGLKNLKVPLPPLPEQQRIVSILDQALAAIDKAKANAEQNLQNAKELFESYLQGIVSNGDQWEKKTLAQIAKTFGRGKSKHRPRNWEGLYGGDYPFIQTGDIRNSKHYITEYSQTYNEVGLAQSKLWPAGTICITIAANIAETGVLTFDACFPDSVIGIEVNEKAADREFVEYLLQSFKVRIQALGKGSAQANINLGTFENELFPFPPVLEQKEIVDKLNQLYNECERLENVFLRKIYDLEELKKSILQKAFAGELETEKAVAV